MARPIRHRPDRRAPAGRAGALASTAAASLLVGVFLGACGEGTSRGGGVVAGSPDGAALYAQTCSACHGTDLRGTSRGPSLLSIVYEPSHHSDESFVRAVREGVAAHHWDFGPMPMVPGLGDGELEAVIAHVRSTQQREGFEPYPPEG